MPGVADRMPAPVRPACEATRADLGAYFRAELRPIRAKRVSAHLECCHACTAIYHAGFHMFD
jgi:anti-sigma factor RsiW